MAVLILAALVDAAIETFWSGSPIRWWVAGPIIPFVALNVWLWRPRGAPLRRFGPDAAASTAMIALMLLLAATAWLPGGQTDGVRMLGQPTSTVLACTLAAILILAAYVMVRGVGFLSPAPKLVTRSVVILLAIYALVGLAVAIVDHATFASLFHGGAVWQRLPRWLQGAFVGGLFLLPVAVLAQLVRVIEHLRRKESVRILVHQATAMVMAFLMASSGLVAPGAVATTTNTTTTARPSEIDNVAPVLTYEQWRNVSPFEGQDPVALAERFSRAAGEQLRRPGADPSDVAAKAAALGGDAEKIFEFLRDQIALEPYRGVLRGARGTLAAGAGNTLDRALLAQALLKAAGIESRLVSGTLSDAQIETLVARYLASSPLQGALASSTRQIGNESSQADAADVATKVGLRPDRVDGVLRRANARADAFWTKTDKERAAQFELLSGELRRGGVAPLANGPELRQLRDRLKEHYWLQVKDALDSWSEFDPNFPGATRGAAFASGASAVSAIPNDRVHRFEFSLVYWTGTKGNRKPEVLLKAESAAADALFEPLDFRIQPAETTVGPNALGRMDAAQKIEALRNVRKFQGVLRAGSKVVGGRPFDLAGHTFDQTGGPATAVSGLTGGLFALGGQEAPPEFADLQVVLRLTGPGRAPMTQTRTLVRAADLQTPTF